MGNSTEESVSVAHKQKTCTKCKETKSVDEFYKDKNSPDRLCYTCKTCKAVDGKLYYRVRPKKNSVNPNIKEKSCGMCKETKPVTEFFKNKATSDGLGGKCKNCTSKCKNLRNSTVDPNLKEKTCTKCKNTKSVTEFNKNKRNIDGFQYTCRVCNQSYYNDRDPEHRDEINKRRAERYKEDEEYRLRFCLSSSLLRVLKGANGSKRGSILSSDYLNCTQKELCKHLQSTKDPKWTDEDLHVDHIIPVSLFNHTDEIEIKKCWNLRNLRYLPAAENISKSNNLNMKLIKEYGIEDLLPKKMTWQEKGYQKIIF